MGIERFFNSIKQKYNIVKDIQYPYSKIESKYLFFDFNSIIHSVSQNIIKDLNNLIYEYYSNGNILNEIKDFYNLDLNLKKTKIKSENKRLEIIKKKLNSELINNLIIKKVLDNVLFILENNFENQLKLLYISIDGTPSKSKMIEQKKRRYMGEFVSIFKEKILNKMRTKISIQRYNLKK